jgi:hypothetical protein
MTLRREIEYLRRRSGQYEGRCRKLRAEVEAARIRAKALEEECKRLSRGISRFPQEEKP